MYNMCILHAPLIADPEQAAEGTGELALGFANRSAAFYHLNKHEECLKVRTGSHSVNRSAAFYNLNKHEECLKVRTGSTDLRPSTTSTSTRNASR